MAPITETPEWRALDAHFDTMRDVHLRDLFADDPDRGERLTVEVDGVYLDYSKQRITDETLRLLVELAERAGLRDRIDAMFRGEKINVTEDRAVLHVALRAPEGAVIEVDGENVVPDGARRCSARWPTSRSGCAAGSGPATPASASATWSTSASAAPTSARTWPTTRSATSRSAT